MCLKLHLIDDVLIVYSRTDGRSTISGVRGPADSDIADDVFTLDIGATGAKTTLVPHRVRATLRSIQRTPQEKCVRLKEAEFEGMYRHQR